MFENVSETSTSRENEESKQHIYKLSKLEMMDIIIHMKVGRIIESLKIMDF